MTAGTHDRGWPHYSRPGAERDRRQAQCHHQRLTLGDFRLLLPRPYLLNVLQSLKTAAMAGDPSDPSDRVVFFFCFVFCFSNSNCPGNLLLALIAYAYLTIQNSFSPSSRVPKVLVKTGGILFNYEKYIPVIFGSQVSGHLLCSSFL